MPNMASFSRKTQVLVTWMVLMAMLLSKTNANCAFQAIFNFGDSNSDTGGFYAAFPSQSSPYGMTYFGMPSGRGSDGRLFIDFFAQALGLPFISPYLQSIGSDYRHGCNFATLASTVLQPTTSLFQSGLSPFYLQVQVNQMKRFKAIVDSSQGQGNLPTSDIFGKSLYTINIGQNDFTGYLTTSGPSGVHQIGPQSVAGVISAIKELYGIGGRTFMVFNLGPVGCYPSFIAQFPHQASDLDGSGCVATYNEAVKVYNQMLKDAIAQVRQELQGANVIYVDTHSVMLEFFQNPTAHGLQHGPVACCGYGGGQYNFNKDVFCGNEKASACSDPQNYVSWDGVHLTEAANKLLASAVVSSSSYFDPAFSLNQYCDVQPIG